MLKMTPLLALAAAVGFGGVAEAQTTLKAVQDRGSLICGVNQGLEGFGSKDDKGEWSGFDVDF
jgi:general L-amino acid transport system substrate-binding protein